MYLRSRKDHFHKNQTHLVDAHVYVFPITIKCHLLHCCNLALVTLAQLGGHQAETIPIKYLCVFKSPPFFWYKWLFSHINLAHNSNHQVGEGRGVVGVKYVPHYRALLLGWCSPILSQPRIYFPYMYCIVTLIGRCNAAFKTDIQQFFYCNK